MDLKLNIIKDLIEDSIDKFSNYNDPENPYIEIRPIVDAIVLLLEKNIALKIVNEHGELVSTYKIETKELGCENATDFYFESYKFLVAEITNEGFSKLEEVDKNSLTELFKWLQSEHKTDLTSSIEYNSVKMTVVNNIEFVDYSIEDNYSVSDKEGIVEELRKIISNAIRIFENNKTIKINNIDIPNVFHVIRYASNKRDQFKYSAQILLSNNQRENITKFLKANLNNIGHIDFLEDPLDKDSTSIADECFKYECVRFENYNEDTSGYNSDSDRRRHEIENSIYNKITPTKKTVFYVPIHLNGAAWMAIYRIVPTENNIDYISFYRNKISIIANQIRHDSFKTYFNLIRNKIEIIGNNENFALSLKIDQINTYLKLLSAYFSFYTPSFPEQWDGEEDFYLYLNSLVDSNYSFKFYMNKIWMNEIDYDNISILDFEKRLKGSLNRIYLKKALEREKQKRRILVSSATHSLKTELETTLIPLKNDLIKLPINYNFTDEEKLKLELLDYSVRQFYSLTSLSNLVDKIGNENDMVKSGKKDKLFVEEKTQLNVLDCLNKYKFLNAGSKINFEGESSTVLGINIYNIWIGQELLHTFLNTIFQNADAHGVEENNKVSLEVIRGNNSLEFINKTYYASVKINTNKLTGNLYLFSEIINRSKNLKMAIESRNYEFKVILSWEK